jgi:hypothetical protein
MLQVTKRKEETWRECVERYAKEHGLQKEALEFYDADIAAGTDEGKAAWSALYEWDLLDFEYE